MTITSDVTADVQHIEMTATHEVVTEGSRITYRAGHIYLVAKEFAEKLIAEGKAALHKTEAEVEHIIDEVKSEF